MKLRSRWISQIFVVFGFVAGAAAQQPVVTVVADFESDAVATSIGQVEGVLRADCTTRRGSLPARGSHCLAVEIGATQPQVSAVADMLLRNPIRFDSLDELGGFVWITAAPVKVAFRIEDATGRAFESAETTVKDLSRWVPLKLKFDPQSLKALGGEGPPKMPIQMRGVRISTTERGKQTVHLDDLQVAHRVGATDVLDGQFRFNEPTRIYDPGATAGAQVILENRSLEKALSVTVNLSWIQPDGATLKEQTATVDLPNASRGLRSYQTIDFSQKLSTPGLYRVVAKARAAGWTAAKQFETTIAVAPSNRNLARGRGQRFGMRTNLWREPREDQLLELALARDIGVQVLQLDVPWDQLEPREDDFRLDDLATLVEKTIEFGVTPVIGIAGRPVWLTTPADEAQLRGLLTALQRKFGRRVPMYSILRGEGVAADGEFRGLIERLAKELRAAGPIELMAEGFDWPTGDLGPLLAPPGEDAGVVLGIHGVDVGGSRYAPPAGGPRWSRGHAWTFDAPSLSVAGGGRDAVNMLRSYLAASAAGVRGLWWFDLRDDDNDPTLPAGWHGLTRRDFSPKTPLLGYASAAGMLADLTYAGELFQAPAEFETALFIGPDRQVGVIVPKQNCMLPAVVAPLKGVPGEWELRSFDRRSVTLIGDADRPLVPIGAEPLYLTLRPSSAQPRPQVGFAKPWLRAPRVVLAGATTTIEIDTPGAVRKGYWQLTPSRDAPFKLSKSAGSLTVPGAQTVRIEFVAAPTIAAETVGTVTLKAALDDATIQLPLEVRPLARIGTKAAEPIATLRAAAGQRTAGKSTVSASYSANALQLVVDVEDERFVGRGSGGRSATRGDELRIGAALEGQDVHGEWRIVEDGDAVSAEPIGRATTTNLPLVQRAVEGKTRRYTIEIPIKALGGDALRSGLRLLIAVQYFDDDDDGYAPTRLGWGAGLAGDGSTSEFSWAELVE
ncbi:MAG: hypothetical protein SF069_13665 [Phycisphaerae bacterium]|nr:hypothetical protein [Phycisphaerae bacterium]